MGKQAEQLLITIQYEKKRGDATAIAMDLAKKGHTVAVTRHMELWEAEKEVHDGEVVKHEQ